MSVRDGPVLSRLDPLEIYTGLPVGPHEPPPALPEDVPVDPRAALEDVLVEALSAPPCVVLFSGGRDSAIVLAAAMQVARRHGLPEPTAVTARFPRHRATHESDWQERTIQHLGLADWQKLVFEDEFDALGRYATEALARHGPFWPANSYRLRRYAREVAGGTILTGHGGDELFNPWMLRRVPIRVLWRDLPPRRALKWIAIHQLPRPLRRRAIRARTPLDVTTPWLTEEANKEFLRRISEEPMMRSREQAYRMLLASRYAVMSRRTLDTFAAEHDARLVMPFWDPRVMLSVARSGPPDGHQSRSAALEALFPDLLPTDVLRRTSKAHFTEAVWGDNARSFAAEWDGRGVDLAVVEPELLRAAWLRPMPHARSLGGLHQAWVSSRRTS